MQVTKITATPRTDNGKGASRRLRAAGQLPAVTYGPGVEAQGLVVSPDDVIGVLNSALGKNSLVDLEIDGKSVHAMIGEYQYHPVTRKLLHADFIQVNDDSKVDVKVPLILKGKAKGVTLGGKLRQVFRELPIRCIATSIPVDITHDITELGLDKSLKVADLNLPEGIEVLLGEKRTVAAIEVDRRAKKDDEESAAADAK